MDAIRWLEENKKNFSIEMNGYPETPIGPYMTTLPLIDRSGDIIDLGCGNGMLLKFLSKFSGHALNPHGIEINPKIVNSARIILPEYQNQFQTGNVRKYNFEKKFDIIIANPFYSKDVETFTKKCLNGLSKKGKLIYRIHNDVLHHHKISKLEEIEQFKKFHPKVSRGDGLSFCTFEPSNPQIF